MTARFAPTTVPRAAAFSPAAKGEAAALSGIVALGSSRLLVVLVGGRSATGAATTATASIERDHELTEGPDSDLPASTAPEHPPAAAPVFASTARSGHRHRLDTRPSLEGVFGRPSEL